MWRMCCKGTVLAMHPRIVDPERSRQSRSSVSRAVHFSGFFCFRSLCHLRFHANHSDVRWVLPFWLAENASDIWIWIGDTDWLLEERQLLFSCMRIGRVEQRGAK